MKKSKKSVKVYSYEEKLSFWNKKIEKAREELEYFEHRKRMLEWRNKKGA